MSAKPVAEKLLIKPGTTLWSSHPDRLDLIQPPPHGVRTVEGPEQETVALVFADEAGALRELLAAHGEQLTRPDMLWVAYPKANRRRPQPRHPVADPGRAWHAAHRAGGGGRGVVGPAVPASRGRQAPFTGGR